MDPVSDYGLDSYKDTEKLEGKITVITDKNDARFVFSYKIIIINSCDDFDIGRAVAWAFAREGATIVISYLNEHEDANEIQQAISKIGRECTG
ncbi:unnamed protein product [Rotaria sp. Silwood1]|nr:unnamed protein product [Rotaria sp. Silwood1]CAF3860855.1 unnamed protein product [Rotaria sp. Silwood1]CAF4650760.1 unnamed protein product [Rotaria sp. Silwood1]CAF4807928.1 unnamed protein product [Rotaria sp. Silwood1]